MKRKILAGLTIPLALLVLWAGAWTAKDINAGDWKLIPAFLTLWIFSEAGICECCNSKRVTKNYCEIHRLEKLKRHKKWYLKNRESFNAKRRKANKVLNSR